MPDIDYEQYKAFVETADQVMLVLATISLGVIVYFDSHKKQVSSTLISTGCLVGFGGFMTAYTPLLSSAGLAAKNSGNDVLFWGLATVWFIGYFLVDCVALLAIWRLHIKHRCNYNPITKSYMLSFFFAGLLQLVQFANKIFFDHVDGDDFVHGLKGMNEIYQVGILTINTSTTLVAMGFALVMIYSHKKNNGEDLPWTF